MLDRSEVGKRGYLDPVSYTHLGWMGAREFLGKDYHMSTQGGKPNVRVSYLLTAWPDYADDGQYVTTIEITDPAVFVLSLIHISAPSIWT